MHPAGSRTHWMAQSANVVGNGGRLPCDESSESIGDRVDGRLVCGGADHEVVDVVVVGERDLDTVDLEQDGSRQPTEALVAVDERVVLDDRLQHCGCLRPDVRVGVIAVHSGLRAGDR